MEVFKMKDYFTKKLVLVSLVLFLSHLGILFAQNAGSSTNNSGSYISITDSINDRVLDEKSYGEVAQMLTHPLLLELANKLGLFTDETLPHEAKNLRRDIGSFRIYIDIFPYAFEYDEEFDVWSELREDLDKGYEVMGKFKDLFDTQGVDIDDATYDESEVKRYRKKVLKWKKRFLKPVRLTLYKFLLRHPSTTGIYSRPKDKLSKFFWGGVKIVPDPEINGIQNIAMLIREINNIAIQDYSVVKSVSNLTDEENEEVFHDFRKRVRSTIKLLNYFPEVLIDQGNSDEFIVTMDLIKELVSNYGAVNDLITSYHLAEERGQRRKQRRLKRQIKEEFSVVKEWQTENNIGEVLQQLDTMIINNRPL